MYEEPSPLNSVAKFHETFDHPIVLSPKIPQESRAALRISLLEEELQELKEGVNNKSIVEIADALCDLQYVLSGAVLEFGLGNEFKNLFDEVQRSNMSKACKDEREANETIDKYSKQGIACKAIRKGDLYIVYRSEDNKIMKSVNYLPASLDNILNP